MFNPVSIFNVVNPRLPLITFVEYYRIMAEVEIPAGVDFETVVVDGDV